MPYCGRTYRVQDRVEKFIDEKTGYMKRMKTPAVILEGVTCQARYSNHRIFCPRAIFSWWREIWLERVPVHAQPQAREGNGAHPIPGLARNEFRNRLLNSPITSKSTSGKEPSTTNTGTASQRQRLG